MSLLLGIHAVLEALRSPDSRLEKIFVQRGQANPRLQGIIDLAREKHVPVIFEERSWLDRKAEGGRHQGVAAYQAAMSTLSPEEIVEGAKDPGLLLLLDGIEDPHNLGAILRSAEVAGVDGVFIPRRRSAGLSPATVRSSAGAAAHVRVAYINNPAQWMEKLKEKGYWIVGLDAEAGKPIWEADLGAPTILVLGNEGSGLHRLVKERCDFLLRIPVRGKVSSHNVSVAAGIVLYEVVRQRVEKGIREYMNTRIPEDEK
jgi:23S rRNA (guanosine2251-2'-O)-methyltransferase